MDYPHISDGFHQRKAIIRTIHVHGGEMAKQPKVLIIGAGFGGLFTAEVLANQPVEVVLIDKNNFHTFSPLLYQVATSALDPSQIAYPVRTIFRKITNVQFLLGEVTEIEAQAHTVTVRTKVHTYKEDYDYLVLAAGSVPNYFGLKGVGQRGFDLRTLQDAVRLRNHVLRLFEQAIWETDYEVKQSMLNIVVVGGGPTGLETAKDIRVRQFVRGEAGERIEELASTGA